MFKILTWAKCKEFTESMADLENRYDKTFIELNACVKGNEAYKKRNADLEEQHTKLVETVQKLELERDDRIINANIIKDENKELKKLTENFQALLNDLADFRERNYEMLEQSNPIILKDFYDIITGVQRTIVHGSLRIRDVNGIAYRDGANDALKILKDKIGSYMKQAVIKTRKKKMKDDELNANVEG